MALPDTCPRIGVDDFLTKRYLFPTDLNANTYRPQAALLKKADTVVARLFTGKNKEDEGCRWKQP